MALFACEALYDVNEQRRKREMNDRREPVEELTAQLHHLRHHVRYERNGTALEGR